jgi:hypothetical protein
MDGDYGGDGRLWLDGFFLYPSLSLARLSMPLGDDSGGKCLAQLPVKNYSEALSLF